jgi:hypothetical protein
MSVRNRDADRGRSHAAPGWFALLLGILSAGAAGVHGGVMAEHFREAAIFGVFFAVVSGLQLVWAARVLVRPTSGMLAAGAAGNAVVILTWAASRTVGVPLGPEPGIPEAVKFVDAATTALEVGIVVCCVVALIPNAARCLRAQHARSVGVAVSIIAGGVAIVAVSAAGGPEGSAEAGAASAHAAHAVVILCVAVAAVAANLLVRRVRTARSCAVPTEASGVATEAAPRHSSQASKATTDSATELAAVNVATPDGGKPTTIA